MSSVVQESIPVKASDFSEFGKPYSGYWEDRDKDPVDRCLPGAFLSDKFQTAQLDMCPDFMSQRCARDWDSKCDLYFESLENINEVRDFLSKTLSKKFCRLADDSKCTIECQPFDPIAQSTAKVCTYLGSEPLRDRMDNLDIGYYFPVNMSPDYMGKCMQTCDVVAPNKIDEHDPIIDKILNIGYRSQVLTQLCQLSLDSKTPISNPRLQSYCTQLVKEKEEVEKKTKEGYKGIIASPMKPSSESTSSSPSSSSSSSRAWIWIVLSLLLLSGAGYLLYQRSK